MLVDFQIEKLVEIYPVVHELPVVCQHALIQTGQPVSVAAGEPLFWEGDISHSFLFILGGTVRVFKTAVTGREILYYRLRAGDTCLLTVSALMSHTPYTAHGVAESRITAVAISRHLFLEFVLQSETFRTFVFHFVHIRVSQIMEMVEEVAFQRLDQRLAARLLKMESPAATTHQLLAEELGSVREVISRLLRDFQAEGLVRLTRGKIYIQNAHALSQIAHPFGDTSHRQMS